MSMHAFVAMVLDCSKQCMLLPLAWYCAGDVLEKELLLICDIEGSIQTQIFLSYRYELMAVQEIHSILIKFISTKFIMFSI